MSFAAGLMFVCFFGWAAIGMPIGLAMIASGFLGTVLGRHVLMRSADERFHKLLSVVLTLLALRLLWEGIGSLAGWS